MTLTVGQLKAALEGLPDDLEVFAAYRVQNGGNIYRELEAPYWPPKGRDLQFDSTYVKCAWMFVGGPADASIVNPVRTLHRYEMLEKYRDELIATGKRPPVDPDKSDWLEQRLEKWRAAAKLWPDKS